jgi:hypothetical protein
MAGTEHLVWRKSQRCDSGTCVEVAATAERVFMRDSKHPDGPLLSVDHTQWDEFLRWLKRQED